MAHDLQSIGYLWDGHHTKTWVPVLQDPNAPQPYPPKSDSWSKPETSLFISIASFRDARCGRTLFNLLTKAAHPERLTIGVVQQGLKDDDDCLDSYCQSGGSETGAGQCKHSNRIRILRTDAEESAGPCWGRHLQSYLLDKDQEFCMQTDSHMDVVQDWDVYMMKEWAATSNEYGVLSTYCQDSRYLGVNVQGHYEVAHLCEFVIPANQVRNKQALALKQMTRPKLTTTWAAGYSFSKCHAERTVPYDPYLPQIFDGEEFSRFVRLFTHGYDVYTPSRSYITHDYGKNNPHAQLVARNSATSEVKASNKRLWNLLEMPGKGTKKEIKDIQSSPWGLGDKRSLDQLMEFSAIDLRKKEFTGPIGHRCGGIEWVPFKEEWPPMVDNIQYGPFW
ncbi:unnamed protein product [Chrysoparadoxa australica]